MRRILTVLATALSMVMLEFVAAASAAPSPVTGPSYTTGFGPSEVAALGRRAQLELIAMTGMTYNPLTQVYRLTDDTSVNYFAAFRRIERNGG